MRFALNSLAVVAPDWLLARLESAWLDRYGHRIEEAFFPKKPAERQVVAEVIGRDGSRLLSDIFDPTTPAFLRDIPAVQMLRWIWVQNYCYEDNQLHWREQGNIPPAAQFITSPYDPDARFSKKRSIMWTGYKVHLTETREKSLPHLITHVATTPAPRTDEARTEIREAHLHQANLSPQQHLPGFRIRYLSSAGKQS